MDNVSGRAVVLFMIISYGLIRGQRVLNSNPACALSPEVSSKSIHSINCVPNNGLQRSNVEDVVLEKFKHMSLREWQRTVKPRSELICQSTTTDGKSRFVPPPIGLSHYVTEGVDVLENLQLGTHHKTVVSIFGDTTDQNRRGGQRVTRKSIVQILARNGIKTQTVRLGLSFTDYALLLSSHKFAISPEGNGVDCHRHYESLLFGTIPVVEYSSVIRNKYGNVPILYTHNYSEINSEYLEKMYREMLDKTWDFRQLFLSFWPKAEQELIKTRSNFWFRKRGKKLWYGVLDSVTLGEMRAAAIITGRADRPSATDVGPGFEHRLSTETPCEEKRLVPFLSTPSVQTTFRYNTVSFPMMVHPDDWISRRIKQKGFYGPVPTIYDLFRRGELGSGSFLDVGANIGAISFFAAALGLNVFSIEALEENVRRFKETQSVCGFGNRVTLFKKAVSNYTGCLTIYTNHGDKMNFGGSSLRPRVPNSEALEVVRATRLDEIDSLMTERFSFMKVDVGGSECTALEGARGILRSGRVQRLFVEVNPDALVAAGCSVGTLKNIVHELGFDTSSFPNTRTKHSSDALCRWIGMET